jgi:hypothetical protein
MDILEIKYARTLAQSHAPNTNAYSIYAPDERSGAGIRSVVICNASGANATASIYMDYDGNTMTNVTAIAYGMLVQANQTVLLEFSEPGLIMSGQAGSTLGVQSNTANVMTFTVTGYEVR